MEERIIWVDAKKQKPPQIPGTLSSGPVLCFNNINGHRFSYATWEFSSQQSFCPRPDHWYTHREMGEPTHWAFINGPAE